MRLVSMTAVLLSVALPVHAVVFCARPRFDGTFSAGVKVREACKPRETQLDPVALGLQGPPGPQGVPGPQGEPGTCACSTTSTTSSSSTSTTGPCIPSTCEQLNAGCGTVNDGCGGTLDCGVCCGGSIQCLNVCSQCYLCEGAGPNSVACQQCFRNCPDPTCCPPSTPTTTIPTCCSFNSVLCFYKPTAAECSGVPSEGSYCRDDGTCGAALTSGNCCQASTAPNVCAIGPNLTPSTCGNFFPNSTCTPDGLCVPQ